MEAAAGAVLVLGSGSTSVRQLGLKVALFVLRGVLSKFW